MLKFKRQFKGYCHILFAQAVLVYYLFTGDLLNPFLQILIGISCLTNAVLLVQYVMTTYLTIDGKKLTITRDFLLKKIIFIEQIRHIKFASGIFPYGKIRMKNGSTALFRDDYLDAAAKAALMQLERRST